MYPEQRSAIVGVVGVTLTVASHVLDVAPANPLVDAVDGARRRERFVQAAPDHGKHLPEGALEAPVRVVAGDRVVRDRLRHGRVGDLEQRRASTAEEGRGVAVDLPQRRVRSEQPGDRVRDAGGEGGQAGLELGGGDRPGGGGRVHRVECSRLVRSTARVQGRRGGSRPV